MLRGSSIALLLVACRANSSDVPSLNTRDTHQVKPTSEAADGPLDEEAKVMAFVQCMRNEGVEFTDPPKDSGQIRLSFFVDPDGNRLELRRSIGCRQGDQELP